MSGDTRRVQVNTLCAPVGTYFTHSFIKLGHDRLSHPCRVTRGNSACSKATALQSEQNRPTDSRDAFRSDTLVQIDTTTEKRPLSYCGRLIPPCIVAVSGGSAVEKPAYLGVEEGIKAKLLPERLPMHKCNQTQVCHSSLRRRHVSARSCVTLHLL